MPGKKRPFGPRWVTYEMAELIRRYNAGGAEFDRVSAETLRADPRLRLDRSRLRRENEILPQLETQRRLLGAALGVTGPVVHEGKVYEEVKEGVERKDAVGLFVEIPSPYDGTARLKRDGRSSDGWFSRARGGVSRSFPGSTPPPTPPSASPSRPR